METENVGRILNFRHVDLKLLKPLNIRPIEYSDIFNSSGWEVNEHDFSLKFDDEFYTAKSILDFLDGLGFNSLDRGYRYLHDIFNYCINNNFMPVIVKSCYAVCAKKYNISLKSVEIAIIGALNSALTYGNLNKFNDIFGSDKIINGHISNGSFIMTVCQRFILSKEFNQPINFRA